MLACRLDVGYCIVYTHRPLRLFRTLDELLPIIFVFLSVFHSKIKDSAAFFLAARA